MLNKFDLYDVYGIFIMMRFCPNYEQNEKIIDGLLYAIDKSRKCDDFNQIRTTIKALQLDKQEYNFLNTINTYSYVEFLKNDIVYKILKGVLVKLKKALNHETEETFEQLIDMVHSVPLIITRKHFKIKRQLWN